MLQQDKTTTKATQTNSADKVFELELSSLIHRHDYSDMIVGIMLMLWFM